MTLFKITKKKGGNTTSHRSNRLGAAVEELADAEKKPRIEKLS